MYFETGKEAPAAFTFTVTVGDVVGFACSVYDGMTAAFSSLSRKNPGDCALPVTTTRHTTVTVNRYLFMGSDFLSSTQHGVLWLILPIRAVNFIQNRKSIGLHLIPKG